MAARRGGARTQEPAGAAGNSGTNGTASSRRGLRRRGRGRSRESAQGRQGTNDAGHGALDRAAARSRRGLAPERSQSGGHHRPQAARRMRPHGPVPRAHPRHRQPRPAQSADRHRHFGAVLCATGAAGPPGPGNGASFFQPRKRMARMIDDILDFARPLGGEIPHTPPPRRPAPDSASRRWTSWSSPIPGR